MDETRFDRILVTAALPYANGPIHIGHLAGAYLPADLYCRYQRLKGRDVLFICGSDELGVAILMRALEEGTTPQAIVDRYHPMIRDSFARFGMSFDYYGRTTSPVHFETSQDFFRRLDEKGVFKLKTEKQLYDPEAGIFLADRFVRGTCPICGYEDAYGDQCERCGSSLSPTDLINPRSVLSNATPELRETTHWYLPLGDFQPKLEAWIATHPEWKPNVLGQVRSWLQQGLRDRAVTRDIPWGVPVPEDVARRHGVPAEGKVLYVWFDAPIGYISATREWAQQKGDPEAWRRYWQDERTRLIHFIGKDNIVFHCLMFPAMLMAHGEFVLPDNVPANEFLNLEGRKLSTSRGWAVWLHEYLEEFPPDLLRYALATMLPETRDADFSWKEFQQRVNAELADILGNFVHRTLTFAQRFAERRVPPLRNPRSVDEEVLRELATFPERIGSAYEQFRFREAVQETMNLARLGNKYFNDTEPWHTRKTDPQACANTIHVSLQICAALGILMEPVLPFAAARLREMLRLEGVRSSTPGGEGQLGWDDAARPLLPEGHEIGRPEILFTKIEDEVIERQIARLEARAQQAAAKTDGPPYAPLKPEIVYDDFDRLDLRVGRVEKAERVPKSKKLLRLEVDLGFEKRQILAGVAEQMAPEDLEGRRVVVVANLKPRKMMGLESQGMLLMAEDREGRLVPVTAESEPGAVVR
ncbi:methionine--tRNA ligase [Rhodothermus marinus]|uniref:Methionine--tRNA ligase n=1 Tax=Rhodothermus marinus (strain ATCC 43812 / DSM 4252 / R-10) TaxID=518766 RepID=D0MIZ7_RHOM4|nr:methionine--tRNA ligase [Rhodothermus marinus]ACY48455.1 methionyl-tRNA synthetase [Rhodothermus marinus DSM 4252]